jgi:hypothetical protein
MMEKRQPDLPPDDEPVEDLEAPADLTGEVAGGMKCSPTCGALTCEGFTCKVTD